MNLIDLHEDLAFSNQQGVDVINGDNQSSLKLLSQFERVIVFGSIFPHTYTLDERSILLSNLYGKKHYSTTYSFDTFWDQLKFYYFLERKKYVKILRRREDLNYLQKINLIISLEGADVLRDYLDLYLLRELNILSIGLTWNYDNKFAASCVTNKDYGLTDDGENLVKLANELGIIIDLAHASKRTVLDTCSVTKKPVIVSHANVKKLKDHKRNLDDEEIEAIIRTDGVIGITAIPSTLRRNSIEDVKENISYIAQSFGWRYVALGTDFLGIDSTPERFESVLKVKDLDLDGHEREVLWENPMRVISKNL